MKYKMHFFHVLAFLVWGIDVYLLLDPNVGFFWRQIGLFFYLCICVVMVINDKITEGYGWLTFKSMCNYMLLISTTFLPTFSYLATNRIILDSIAIKSLLSFQILAIIIACIVVPILCLILPDRIIKGSRVVPALYSFSNFVLVVIFFLDV